MRTLPPIAPTPEQLPLIRDTKPGVSIIRGAAGSGKTTTALLRLRQLAAFWLSRREREGIDAPVRILVVTFNRTLRGYITDLAKQQVIGRANLDLEIRTFARWAMTALGVTEVIGETQRDQVILGHAHGIDLPRDFLLAEVDYLLGRFLPQHFNEYLTCRRDGRGNLPRVDRSLRQRILEGVVRPYVSWKQETDRVDWNDLAILAASIKKPDGYDVIIADEVQDFSANQIRALMHHANDPSSVTFVLDAAQRIYPRGFTWAEAGVAVNPANSHRLGKNYRNTKEICRFALPLLKGLEIGDDGTFPDFDSCSASGTAPIILTGKYSQQINYVIEYMRENVDLSKHSVAFLKPKGGRWFDELKRRLDSASYSHVTITKQSEWPAGDENTALSTMNSAKGLEFDYVFILGLSGEVTIETAEPEDSTLDNLRRLLAMAITRARKMVILGYKPTEASHLVSYFDPNTFEAIKL